MGKTKKEFTLTSKILMTLLAAGDMLLVTPRELRRRVYKDQYLGDGSGFASIVYYLAQKGLIKYVDKNNQRFVKITKKGELKILLAMAKLPGVRVEWDGKWRVIIFDIPEDSYTKRQFFRTLLKRNGFVYLQASVYISPYPLNREAIKYLKETGLINYIRIMKVEEMDDDKDLKKKFDLK